MPPASIGESHHGFRRWRLFTPPSVLGCRRSALRLVRRGFLQTIPDVTDRRRLTISLSDAGRAAYAEHLAHAFAVTEETLEPLTADERRALLATLEKLR